MSLQLPLNFGNLKPAGARKADRSAGIEQRELRHEGGQLLYQLSRSRRKSIGFVVGENGLRVTAPTWVSLQQIEAALHARIGWILRKLQEVEARHQRLAISEQNWCFGGLIPYLGSPLEICGGDSHGAHHSDAQRAIVWYDGDPQHPHAGGRLWLPLPQDAQAQRIREMSQGWLQSQARSWFGARLQFFEQRCGLKPSSWRLSSASTRWGSCNSKGQIGLNWRLIHFEPTVIDYVIAHELAHLRELNHSDAFWRTLAEIYPDYLKGHQALKAHVPGVLPVL